ncbi:MAG: Uma2 family endonuclease [Psychrosphaera sp.]|nr:Uma2 family endonuclease [Psychrosphaera sp.]
MTTQNRYISDVNGEVFAMAGAKMNHERIAGNVYRKFGDHLENSPCEPFGSDMQVHTPSGSYRYPDCMVVCDSQSDNDTFTETPVILVEVISHSTRKTDEQTKRLEYMNIPSLLEYVIIEQDYVDVCVFRKNQHWQPTHYFLGDDVVFESIDLTLPVAAVYQRVVNDDMGAWLENQQGKLEQS